LLARRGIIEATLTNTTPQLIAVTRERYAGKKWARPSGYGFAATKALVPIVGTELRRAALSLPLAFVQDAGRFVLVAVLSATPGRNMLVGADGRWLGNYIPACLRGYPFSLVPSQEPGKLVLCIDQGAGAVGSNGAGEDFYDQEGNLSPALKKVLDFLSQLERSRAATNATVSALAEAGVIRAWSIQIKGEDNARVIAALHRVDEAALRTLSDGAFLKLRDLSALPIAYAQLLSMALIAGLTRLARSELKPKFADLPDSLDSLFGLSTDDIIKF
jgi:hypothetical protein